MVSKWIKRGWYLLAIVIVTIALVVSLTRALTPWAAQYKGAVERQLSGLVGAPVNIQSMQTGWYWWTPVIKLNQVSITPQSQQSTHIKQLQIGINLFDSLWNRKFISGLLYADAVKVKLEQKNNRWYLNGHLLPEATQSSAGLLALSGSVNWFVHHHKIILRHSSVNIAFANRRAVTIRGIRLDLARAGNDVRLRANASLQQKIPTTVKLLALLTVNDRHPEKISGEVYAAIGRLQPAQWQDFYQHPRFKVDSGTLSTQLWFDIHKGKLSDIQGQTNASKFYLTDRSSKKAIVIDTLQGNWLWQNTSEGFAVSIDKLKLKLNDQVWPQNALKLTYQQDADSWTVYAKYLPLQSLLSLPLPAAALRVKNAGLEGSLRETTVTVTAGEPVELLTQFDALGWQQFADYPKVKGLFGALYWEPEQGRVKLNAANVLIKPRDKPEQTFTRIALDLNWKKNQQGWQISLGYLQIQHPKLRLRSYGQLQNVGDAANTSLDLQGRVRLENGSDWLQYIPANYLKPKLEKWLKNDIKKITSLNATFSANGKWADFPYDNAPGEFSINGHLSGVDLYFAEGWPISKNVEAWLELKNRSLNVDIVRADLNEVPVEGISLKIPDMGRSQDTLLVHGQLNAPANKTSAYILQSPLKNRLFLLQQMAISGDLGIDLSMEIPLVAQEGKTTRVEGKVRFKDNALTIRRSVKDVHFSDVDGTLYFDELGLQNSQLNAVFFNHPVKVVMTAHRDDNPRTEIRIHGKTTVDALKASLNAPILALMQGKLKLESLIVLTDDPSDLDHMVIQTSLKNVAIALPLPYGKKVGEKKPLAVAVEFNSDRGVRFRIDYASLISADLWFQSTKLDLSLQKGEIRIGTGKSVLPVNNGLRLVGMLPQLDVSQWRKALDKLPETKGKSNFLDKFTNFDLSLQQLKLNDWHIDKVVLQGTQTRPGLWSVGISQKQIQGRLDYEPATRTVSGVLDYLKLPEFKAKDKPKAKFSVKDKPNLNLSIRDLKYKEFDIGQASLKMQSVPGAWILQQGEIKTPAYTLSAKGKWQQGALHDTTQMDVNIKILDLAKALTRWHINPAVEAHKGDIVLSAQWQGSYADFALAKTKGQLQIQLKDGRITNLGPEAEEKLGLGKLLSILSLQTIPRRLKLDFSDLANQGYTFDEFNGKFIIQNGRMSTKESEIDGPVAYASMRGSLDIINQTYDMELRISPHITASLPIVATIAGGPLAGAAVWVANKLISQGMQKINAYTYRITGPWKKPVVEQGGLF